MHHRLVQLCDASARLEVAGGADGDIMDTEVGIRHL